MPPRLNYSLGMHGGDDISSGLFDNAETVEL
jgi:hypothetical protein